MVTNTLLHLMGSLEFAILGVHGGPGITAHPQMLRMATAHPQFSYVPEPLSAVSLPSSSTPPWPLSGDGPGFFPCPSCPCHWWCHLPPCPTANARGRPGAQAGAEETEVLGLQVQPLGHQGSKQSEVLCSASPESGSGSRVEEATVLWAG